MYNIALTYRLPCLLRATDWPPSPSHAVTVHGTLGNNERASAVICAQVLSHTPLTKLSGAFCRFLKLALAKKIQLVSLIIRMRCELTPSARPFAAVRLRTKRLRRSSGVTVTDVEPHDTAGIDTRAKGIAPESRALCLCPTRQNNRSPQLY